MHDSRPALTVQHKLVALEAVRGIAAVLVVLHHAMAGFAPRLHGLFDPPSAASLFGTPLFALINGSAAVIVFFVLSGFVLTIRLIDARPSAILGAGLKRWPRLMLPVLAVNLVSGLLMGLGIYYNLPAAAATRSIWLAQFFTWPSQGLLDVVYAGAEGMFGTFLLGTFRYNSNIWTMYYELFGSYVVFIFSFLCIFIAKRNNVYLLLSIFFVISILSTTFIGAFIAGMIVAVFYKSTNSASWSARTLLSTPLIFLLMGYHESLFTGKPEGFYAFLSGPAEWLGAYRLRVVLHTIASVAIILLVLKVQSVKAALSNRIGALLGRLSFPIYLTHFLIIASIGSWTYLAIGADNRFLAIGGAILATFAGTFLTALPIMALDEWWLKRLNRWTARATRTLE